MRQLKELNKILKKKREIKNYYQAQIKNLKKISFVNIFKKNYLSNNWLNIIKIESKKNLETEIVNIFKKNGVMVRPIWFPLSKQQMNLKYQSFMVSDTKSIIKNNFCLPSSSYLSHKDIKKVVSIIKKVEKII